MKIAVAVIVALLVGLSFTAGVMHGRGELSPLVTKKLNALGAWMKAKLSAFVLKFAPK